MSHTVASPAAPAPARDRREERKVIAGTVVGTTIEWYDFFIFAQATALVFAALFFQPMGESGKAREIGRTRGSRCPSKYATTRPRRKSRSVLHAGCGTTCVAHAHRASCCPSPVAWTRAPRP